MRYEKSKRKQFAVLGLGRFGSTVAHTLFEKNMEVFAVDENEAAVLKIQDSVTHSAVADVSDERVLRTLGIENFDVVIIAIGNDLEASVLATLACKEIGVKKVVAKANSLKHKAVLERVGADEVVIPEMQMGEKVAMRLANPRLHDIMSISSNYSIIEMQIPDEWAGKTLADLDLRRRYEVNVIGVERNGEVTANFAADEPLMENDTLLVGGYYDALDKIQK